MCKVGDKVTGVNSKTPYKIIRELAGGSQGTCWVAEDSSGQSFVYKEFKKQYCNSATKARIQYLVELSLTSIADVLCAPVDWVDDNGSLGHVSANIDGAVCLDELLANPPPLIDSIVLAGQMCHSIAILHENGIVHGDIHNGNVLVKKLVGAWQAMLIDIDNYAIAGIALPPTEFIGHPDFIAPEFRLRKQFHPTIESDCYALAVMMHSLLLLKYPFDSFATGLDQQHRLAAAGYWPYDPLRCKQEPPGGYPVRILNARLMTLFRRGLSGDPNLRPRALEWRDALVDALSKVVVCPGCGGPQVMDNSKSLAGCCLCDQPFPILKLTGPFGTIVLEKSATIVTRELLGGDSSVSSRHATIFRYGPEYRIRDEGSLNGTWKVGTHGWIRLKTGNEPNQQPLLRVGERLRFGKVETTVDMNLETTYV